MRKPFTLYKETTKSGTFWYARFWDETAQKYKTSRSTGIQVDGKKGRKDKAEEVARQLLNEIEKEREKQRLTPTEKNNHLVANTPLIKYLQDFWQPDSQYAKNKKYVEKDSLSLEYIQNSFNGISLHVEPYEGFQGVTVGTLTKPILREWLIWLASRKAHYRKHDGTLIEKENIMSSRRANAVIQSVRVAIRWAFDNEKITQDPFHKLGEITDSPKEKGILTFLERMKLHEIPVTDNRARLVMLLGSYCGLRRGEMRGLKWGDIKDGIIDIKHNFVDKEGEKVPKWNSYRKVPVIPEIEKLLKDIFQQAKNRSPEDYIFESPNNPGFPVSNNFFRDTITKELTALGINEKQQKERILTHHSLRHTFVTLSQLSGLSSAEVMALAGQKREKTLKKYTHIPQVLDFNKVRNKILEGEKNQNNSQEQARAVNI